MVNKLLVACLLLVAWCPVAGATEVGGGFRDVGGGGERNGPFVDGFKNVTADHPRKAELLKETGIDTVFRFIGWGKTRAAVAERGPGALKVFILAGQSNMQGHGKIVADSTRNGGKGSLEHLVKDPGTAARFQHLVDQDGNWIVRDDVWIWSPDRKGGLTVGYGARRDRIGPELGFGIVTGDAFDDQILLIKVAWGGKSLAKDFRPPSSGGEVGPCYRELLRLVNDVLANLETQFPEYDGRGYQLAGFGWHQGWNDRVNQVFNDEYESNLANFIRDVRKDLGVSDLPFVIAETGMRGHEETHPRALSLMRAQAAVAEYDEFKGNVALVGTKDFYRPPEVSPSKQGYHWNSNAETYYRIGAAMGEAMKRLCGK